MNKTAKFLIGISVLEKDAQQLMQFAWVAFALGAGALVLLELIELWYRAHVLFQVLCGC